MTVRTDLRPFFTYFGGKWRAAPRYPRPEYPRIVEPFAGSAGYSLRYPERDVVLYDADPVIAGLWEYLIHVSEQEILSLPDLEPGQTVSDLRISQEAGWLIGFWLNKGVERPMQSASAWMRAGTHDTSFWGHSIRERVASQLYRIRHWKSVHGSFESCDPKPATWFVDPPYQVAGDRYRFGSKLLNFDSLGSWCKSLPGQVIVCENDGATWLPFETFASIKATAGKKRVGNSKEVIWTNTTETMRSAA